MTLKTALAAGTPTLGSWVTLDHPAVAEVMARAGFDWLVVDLEHTGIDMAGAERLIRAIDGAGVPPIVRLPGNDAALAKRVMDCGAHGILVPMVNSAAEAAEAVASVYYPPRGTRGVGLYRAQGYGASFAEYRRWLEDNAVVVVMIETIAAVAAIDAILAVPGVDAWIVGPYDLSASMGRPGDLDHPDMARALERVLAAGRKAGKPGGIHVVEPDPARLRARIDQGFTFLGYGVDIRILDSVCRRDLATMRATP
jgi:2-dehydro-3-deoxyglucarate aldolase